MTATLWILVGCDGFESSSAIAAFDSKAAAEAMAERCRACTTVVNGQGFMGEQHPFPDEPAWELYEVDEIPYFGEKPHG
jgi:hypothetical protein